MTKEIFEIEFKVIGENEAKNAAAALRKEVKSLSAKDVFKGFLKANVATAAINMVTQAVRGAVSATIDFAKDAVSMAIDLESAWNGVRKVYDGNKADIDSKLIPAAERLSVKFGATEKAVAGVMGEFAAMGTKGSKNIDMTTQAMTFASVAAMNHEDAVRSVTAISQGYRVEGERLTEVLALLNSVENAGAIKSEELATGLAKAGGAARMNHVGVAELSSILNVFVANNITASQGANAFKSALGELNKPTKSTRAALEDINVAVKDTSGVLRPAGDIIKDVTKSWDHMTEAQKRNFLIAVGGKTNAAKLSVLFEDMARSSGEYNRVLKETSSSSDNLRKYNEELDISLASTESQINQTTSQINLYKKQLGEAGRQGVGEFAKEIRPVLSKELPEFIIRIKEAGKTLREAMGNVTMKDIAQGIGTVINVMGRLVSYAANVALVMSGMVDGIKAAKYALSGDFAAAAALSEQSFKKITKGTDGAKKDFESMVNVITDASSETEKAVSSAAVNIKTGAISLGKNVPAGVKEGIDSKRSLVVNGASSLKADITKEIKKSESDAKKTGSAIPKNIKDGLSSTKGESVNQAKSIKKDIMNAIKKSESEAKTSGSNIGKELASGIRSSYNTVKSAASNLASAVAKFLKIASPSEEGPMRDLDKWGIRLVDEISKGMTKRKDALKRTAENTAEIIANPVVSTTERINRISQVKNERNVNINMGGVNFTSGNTQPAQQQNMFVNQLATVANRI